MKPRSILIFEDDLDLVLQWKKILIAHSYKIDHSMNYAESLHLCKENQYDLIICDIFIVEQTGNLSGFGGISLLQSLRLREREGFNWSKNVPIIIVSGSYNAEKILYKYKEKFNAHTILPKPFLPQYLLNKVSEILDGDHPQVKK